MTENETTATMTYAGVEVDEATRARLEDWAAAQDLPLEDALRRLMELALAGEIHVPPGPDWGDESGTAMVPGERGSDTPYFPLMEIQL